MNSALEPLLRAAPPSSRLDLATALGVGLEAVGAAGGRIALEACTSLAQRGDYWSFLAEQGLPGRCALESHPDALCLLARRDGEPVAAAALLPLGEAEPAMPAAFRAAIDGLRRQGRLLAALDPVVVAPEQDAQEAGLALRALLRLAILAARRLDGRSDLLLRSEPRYARFFTQVLLFATVAEEPARDGQPAQLLLRLDLDLCPGEWLRVYGDGPWSPYSLHIRPGAQSARLLAWLRAQRRAPTPAELLHGWIRPADGLPLPDDGELAVLRRIHRHAVPAGTTGVRRPGTGALPRIRTPLPD